MAERVAACSLRCNGAVTNSGETAIVVVGGGRIGRAFLQMAGPRAMLVRRGERVTEGEGPVIVATHCSHLDDVLQHTPRSRWADLVFLQNGMLQPWLATRNLHHNTQGLLYMSAAEDTSLPGGRVKVVSGGRDSLVWGRWASVVVSLMHKAGLPSSVVGSHEPFLESVVEKLLWSSIFWLLSAALGGLPVGLIARKHRKDVHDLVTELLPLATKSKPSEPAISKLVQELCMYCMAIETAVPSLDMAISEFEWRNGWFLREKVSPCHLSWLQRACSKSGNLSLESMLLTFRSIVHVSISEG
ncbi:unnamed protein product [Calypogeia fissa]